MKITIIGSKGFIGSHLVKKLNSLGIDCFTPKKNDPEIFNQDLGNVIYAAGVSSDFRQRPFDTITAHVSFLAEMLEKSKFNSFLYISSTRVYIKNKLSTEQSDIVVNPNDYEDLFNISKLMGESICLFSNNKNIKIARLSNVCGYDFNSDNFLYSIIKDALSNNRIILKTTLDSEKDYVHISDVVDILIKISQKGASGIYNIASGFNTSNETITKTIKEVTGCEVIVAEEAKKITFPKIDIEKIKTEFEFKPKDITGFIKDLIIQYKNELSIKEAK